ncbi:D-aminoacyl-tRNA deacylase [Natranaeroarchaeum aerophilus]|uniref:D-aminoacyl-tRNA deacylase n=1 Tax=Natranaeroarchaeum aerophilus TaxID=2917711 RepID=A0AAE3K5T5_9EURY|nr:hypothetical protein [Natranaeroarchaeum aerophilus]
MIAIVVSRADSASEQIFEQLLAARDWDRRVDEGREDAAGGGDVFRIDGFELRTFDDWHLELDDAAEPFEDPDLLVFASRHSGETGPLLTAHFTGNFGPAEFGGQDRSLAPTCPNALSTILSAFDEHAPADYDTGIECTHHGPTEIDIPSMFVELGSGEAEWADSTAAAAVARSILDLRGVEPHAKRLEGDIGAPNSEPPRRHLVGIGGGHYAPRFERLIRETDWHVGHIAADWTLDELGSPERHRDVLDEAFRQSEGELALVADTDRDLDDVRRELSESGYRIVSETWLREVDDVPLALADDLESALSPIDGGLRFGTVPDNWDDYTIHELPTGLLDEAQGIASETVRSAVERTTLAFETVENGNRVRGRVAVSEPSNYDVLIDALVDVLAEEYETVRRENGQIIAETTAFDPSLAREAGVPDGPAFGKLSNGEPVSVDGRTIHPDDVESTRTVTFPA